MQRAALSKIAGAMTGLLGMTNLVPAAVSLYYADNHAQPFLITALLLVSVGAALWWPVRDLRHELKLRDGFLVVCTVWLIGCLTSLLPLWLSPVLDLSLGQALFEGTSGMTTTGATVLSGLDTLPRSLLYYRMQLHFLGGIGIIVFALAILPLLRIGGSQLFNAETSGPLKHARMTPRIAQTARLLGFLYLSLIGICALAYWIAGMGLFDALCHAISTISTGGFANYDASFGHFDSAVIDWIAVFFMLAGGVSFTLHLMAWRFADGSVYLQSEEFRTYARIFVGASLACALVLYLHGVYSEVDDALRHAAFQVAAFYTTTGLASTGAAVGPAQWPLFVPVLLLGLGVLGACAGSTSGGAKTVRAVLLWRISYREVQRLIHPRGEFVVRLGNEPIERSAITAVFAFATLYFGLLGFGGLVFMALGLDAVSAFGAAATCLSNTGPGLGMVATSFADLGDIALCFASALMLIGRLELFTVIVLLAPEFWREV